MKKLIALLAVLALVGCEGSGSNNNNPNPNDPNNPNPPVNDPNNPNPPANNGDVVANNAPVFGTWELPADAAARADARSVSLNLKPGSFNIVVVCQTGGTANLTSKAKFMATQIDVLENKNGPQNCPTKLGASSIAYEMEGNNSLYLTLQNGVFQFFRKGTQPAGGGDEQPEVDNDE